MDREPIVERPRVVIVGSGHESLTAKCREAGYKVTDMIGGMGVIPTKKKERPEIKAMGLAEMFKLK